MYTQCPRCLTIFAIDEDALQASLGIVNCGRCGRRFDALRTLSNALPPGGDTPLAERDAARRVPILTDAVPQPGPGSMAENLHHEDAAGTATPAAEPGASDTSGPSSRGESALPAPERPESDVGSDWFADFETELTTSLLSDATHTFPGDVVAGYAWQVDELPAPAPFTGPDIPMTFWELGPDLDASVAAAEQVPVAHQTAAPDELGALDSFEPWHAPDAPPEPDPWAEVAGWSIDPPRREDAGPPFDGETMPAPGAGPDLAAPADYLTPAGAGAAPATPGDTPGETPPANRLLAHEAVDTQPAELLDASSNGVETADSGVGSDPAEPLAPVYVRPRSRRLAGAAWVLGCLVLALVLAAQLAWIQRVELFRNPATHAWTARACRVIACRLPPIRDVAKLELVSRDVRPDPHAAGALMITATVRNDASFRQPWPVVVVELTDLDNNPVAMRRFRPAEYLPDPARRAAGIAAGAISALAFEVADPGKRAVAFQFSFE